MGMGTEGSSGEGKGGGREYGERLLELGGFGGLMWNLV